MAVKRPYVYGTLLNLAPEPLGKFQRVISISLVRVSYDRQGSKQFVGQWGLLREVEIPKGTYRRHDLRR